MPVNIFLRRDSGGGTVADGIRDLFGQLLPDISDGKQSRNRGHHVLVGDDIALFILFNRVFHELAVGRKTNENEECGRFDGAHLTGFEIADLDALNRVSTLNVVNR